MDWIERLKKAKELYKEPDGTYNIPTYDKWSPNNQFTIPEFKVGDYKGKVRDISPAVYGIEGLMDERAQNQSWTDKWANAVVKMGITAGTTFLDGTVGTLFGLGNMLAGGSFIDNIWSVWMNDLQEVSEEAFPNYYTTAQMTDPWYTQLDTANFWADMVLKNFGFMIGTVASSMIYSGGIRSALGVKNVANKMGKGLFGKLAAEGKAGINSADDLMKVILRNEIPAQYLIDDMAKGANYLKKVDLASQVIGNVAGSIGEARIEAINAAKQYEEEIRRNEPNISEEELKERVTNIMNATFVTNMAILSLGNFAQYGKALSGGYKVSKAAYLNNLKGTLKGGALESTLPTSKMGKAALNTWRTVKSLKNATWEGFEELGQEIASEASMNYYGIDENTEDGVAGYLKSLYDVGKETMGDIDNYEEFAVGFISELLGMPNVAGFYNKNQPIMIGGLIGDMKEYAAQDKRMNEAIKQGNKLADRIKTLGKSAILTIDNEQKSREALIEEDVFSFKNAEHKEIINQALTALELDRFGEYIELLKAQKNMTIDEIKEIFKGASYENGKKVSSEVDPFSGWQDSEIREFQNKRIEAALSIAENAKKYKDDVDIKFKDSSSDVKNEVIWALSSLDDFAKRVESIQKNIAEKYKFKDGRDIEEIQKLTDETIKVEKRQTISKKTLNKTIRNISKLKKSIAGLEKNKKEISDQATVLKTIIDKALDNRDEKIVKTREKYKNTQEKLAQLEDKINALKAEDKAAKEKIVEELKPEGLSVEEFEGKATELVDRIDQFNKKLEEFYKDSPQYANALQRDLVDLNRIENARRALISKLAEAYDPNKKDKLQESIDKEIAKYKQKKYDELFKMFSDNRIVYDTKDNKEKQVKILDGEKFAYSKDDKGEFTVQGDKLEANDTTFERYNLNPKVIEQAARLGLKVIKNTKEVNKGENFTTYYNGDVVTYKDKKYLRVAMIVKGKPSTRYIKILEDANGNDIILPGNSFTITSEDLLKEVIVDANRQNVDIPVGNMYTRQLEDGSYVVYTYHNIRLLEDTESLESLEKSEQEEVDSSENETLYDDDSSDGVRDELVKEVADKLQVYYVTKTSSKFGKKGELNETPITDLTEASNIEDEYFAQTNGKETLEDALKRVAKERAEWNKKEEEAKKKKIKFTETIPSEPKIKRGGENVFISYPPKPPIGFILTRYTKKGKISFQVNNSEKVQEIAKNKRRTRTKKGKSVDIVKYGDKGLSYFVRPVFKNYTNNKNSHKIHIDGTNAFFPVDIEVHRDKFSNIEDKGSYYTATYRTNKGKIISVRINKPITAHRVNLDTGIVYTKGTFINPALVPTERATIKEEDDPITNFEDSEDGSKRIVSNVFSGLAGNFGNVVFNKETKEWEINLNNNPDTLAFKEQLRYQRFVANTNISNGKHKGVVVSGKELFGDAWTEEAKRLESLGYNAYQVYYVAIVDNETGKYLIEDEDRFKPSNELNTNIVYTSLPTYSPFTPILKGESYDEKSEILLYLTKEGTFENENFLGNPVNKKYGEIFNGNVVALKPKFGFNNLTKEKIKDLLNTLEREEKKQKELITKIKAAKANNETFELELKGTSLGTPVRGKVRGLTEFMEKNGLTEENIIIHVATKDEKYSEFSGIEVNLRSGFVYLFDKLHGNIIELRPRTVNQEERKAVIDLLKVWASNVKIDGNNVDPTGAGVVTTKSGDITPIKQLLNDLIGFANVDNLTSESYKKLQELRKLLNDAKASKDGTLVDDIPELEQQIANLEQLNVKEEHQIHMLSYEKAEAMGSPYPMMSINVGGKAYSLLKLDKGKPTNEINPEVVDAVQEFLNNKFIQIGSTKLLNSDNESYSRVIGVENGILQRQEYPSYKAFLYEGALETKQVDYSENNANDVKVNDKQGNKTTVNTVPAFVNQYVVYSEPGEKNIENPTSIKKESVFDEKESKILEKFKNKGLNKSIKFNFFAGGFVRLNAGKKVLYLENVFENDLKNDVIESLKILKEYADENNIKFELHEDFNSFLTKNEIDSILNYKKEETTKKYSREDFDTTRTESALGLDKLSSDLEGGEDPFSEGSFRLMSDTFEGLENIDNAFTWFKERFPNVSIEKVNKLVNGKGWGGFIKGVVYIYENAEIGTTYHEAFHVAFILMLSKAERIALLNEVRNNPKLVDKIAKQRELYKDKSENEILEEVLAEEFRNWKLNNGESDFNSYKGIAGFFKKFLDFIRGLITFNQLINPTAIDIFNRIENGVYAEQNITKTNVEKLRKKNKKPFKFNYDTKNEYYNSSEYISYIMNGVSIGFMKYFFVNKKAEGGISLLTKDMVDSKNVTAAYNLAKNVLIYYYNNAPNEFVKKHIRFAIDNWNETVEIHKQYLKQLSLEFTDYSDIFEEVDETQRDNLKGQTFDTQAIQRSAKESASTATRLLVATLIDGKSLNDFGMPKFVSFGKTFSLLSNKFANTKSPQEIATVIGQLQMEYDFINSLMGRLKITKLDEASLFNELQMTTPDEKIATLKFAQTFAKSFVNFQVGIINEDGKMTIMDATKAQARNNVINHIWLNKFDIEREANPDNYTTDGDYNKKAFLNIIEKNFKNNISSSFEFLKKLGIVFTNQQAIINDADKLKVVIDNARWFLKKIQKSEEDSIPNFFNKEVNSDEYNRLQELIDIETETNGDYFENSIRSFDGKRIYSNVLYSYLSYIINEYNEIKTEEDLNTIMPHLAEDEYSKRSLLKYLILNDKNFKMDYIVLDGFREQKTFSGEEFKNNTKSERLQSKFVAFYKHKAFGYFRPADNKLERFIQFNKLFFDLQKVQDNSHIDKMFEYFQDEIDVLISTKEVPNTNFNNNKGRGIILDLIKNQNESLYNIIIDRINDPKALLEVIEKHKSKINEVFIDFTNNRFENMLQTLEENNLVVIKNSKIELNNLNETTDLATLKSEIKTWLINDFVFKVEMTKMITGDPRFYKNPLDFYKRMSGTVGNKKLAFVDNFTNNFVDKNGDIYYLLAEAHKKKTDNKISNKKITHTLKDSSGNVILKYSVLNDPIFYNGYFDNYLTTSKETYHKMNKSDGIGVITLDAWRQFMIRNGDWGYGEKSLEEFYQWELQHEMDIPEENRIYIDPETKKSRPILKKNVVKVANSIKPQSFGSHANKNINIPAFEKLSFQILIPSLYSEEEFKELKALKEKMTKQGIGIAIFESGVKTGALHSNGEFNSIVDNEGNFNEGLDVMSSMDTYYKYWGIQVDTGNTTKETTPTGVQVVRHIINMIFDAGDVRKKDGDTTDPIDVNLAKAAEEFIKVNNERIEIGIKRLIDKLNLVEENGFYRIDEEGKQDLIRLLQEEAIKRDLSKDTVVAIQNAITNNLGIDVLTNREHLENVLFSIADKTTITQKTYGAGKYQVSSPITGFIKDVEGNDVKVQYALIDKKTKKYIETVDKVTDEMKEQYDIRYVTPSMFYKKDENGGQTKRMIAYISNPFDDSVDIKNLPEELKRIIGYRIPTQTPNSIESIEVEFLPKSVGDIIILPTEIVAKAGSDYDIDKLYTFFNNFYYDTNGQPVYIKYDNVEEQYEDYIKYADSILANRIIRKLRKELNQSILDNGRYIRELINRAIKNSKQEDGTILLSDVLEFLITERTNKTKNIIELNVAIELLENVIDKDAELADVMSLDEFKLKATENRFRELMDYIILHPDNFENLTTPISNDAFTLIKEKLLVPKLGLMENNSFTDLAQLESEDIIYENFMEGADTIGIAAISSTFNVLAQIYDLKIPTKITSFRNYSNPADNKTTETRINLDSNTNEDGTIPLGRYLSAENTSKLTKEHQKEFGDLFQQLKIPMVLSQWINAAVDNAKELIMLAFNSGPDNLGISLYLTMAGVPIAQIGIFMNQPIIKEFTKRKKMSNGLLAKATGMDKSDRDIAIEMVAEINKNLKSDFEEWTNDKRANTYKLGVSSMINSLGTEWKTESQLKYFYEFLRHKDTAGVITNTIQKINYDNKSIGKNSSELISKLTGTDIILRLEEDGNSDIINIGKVLKDKNNVKGFMQGYLDAANKIYSMYENAFSYITKIADDFIAKKSLEFEQRRMPLETRYKILQKMKNDYLMSLINDTPFTIAGVTKRIIDYKNELFDPKKGLYQDLLDFQEIIRVGFSGKSFVGDAKYTATEKNQIFNKIQGNKIIANLSRSSSESVKGRKHMKLQFDESQGYESEQLREDWGTLINSTNSHLSKFGKKLAIFALLQGGYNNSPINFRQFIPESFNNELLTKVAENAKNLNISKEAKKVHDRIFEVSFAIINNDISEIVPNTKSRKISEFKKDRGLLPKYKNLTIEQRISLLKKQVKIYSSELLFKVFLTKEGNITKTNKTFKLIEDNYADLSNGSSLKAYHSQELNDLLTEIFKFTKESAAIDRIKNQCKNS